MILQESILKDGSTVLFYNKRPVFFYNSMFRKIYVNKDLYVRFHILIDKTIDQCYGYDIELRNDEEMDNNVYLIQSFDYSKGELASSPVYE